MNKKQQLIFTCLVGIGLICVNIVLAQPNLEITGIFYEEYE